MNTTTTVTSATSEVSTISTSTTTPIVDVTATVDDVELLNILGLTSNANAVLCNDLAVLDWNDMPELSAEEEDDEEDEDDKSISSKINNKRKCSDQEEDVFANLDFVEVPLVSLKKQKTFVDEEDESELLNLNMDLLPPLDDEIRLALDLISSV